MRITSNGLLRRHETQQSFVLCAIVIAAQSALSVHSEAAAAKEDHPNYVGINYRHHIIMQFLMLHSILSSKSGCIASRSILSSGLDRQQFKANVLRFCHQQYSSVNYKFCTKLDLIRIVVMRCCFSRYNIQLLAMRGYAPRISPPSFDVNRMRTYNDDDDQFHYYYSMTCCNCCICAVALPGYNILKGISH